MDTIWYILGCLILIGVFSSTLLGVIILKQCRRKNKNYDKLIDTWRIHHK